MPKGRDMYGGIFQYVTFVSLALSYDHHLVMMHFQMYTFIMYVCNDEVCYHHYHDSIVELLLNFERLSQNVSEGETFVNIGLVLGGAMWLDTAIEIEVYPVEDGSAES